MSKIRVAFIKYGGLAAGGTEKLVQSLAANLDKDKFLVDYFWCHGSVYIGSDFKFPPTSQERMKYMKDKDVNLIQFNVGCKDVTVPTHNWVDTDFWEKFNQEDYDIVVTGRAGHAEYPFIKINDIPIVDIISLAGHVDNQSNIVKSVHISQWQKDAWLAHGGNPSIAAVIPIFDELPPLTTEDFRSALSISSSTFVFGFHQRAEPGIFSPVPLQAFSDLQKQMPDTSMAFILLGGADFYRKQAAELNLKNAYFLEHTGSPATIGKFLNTLNAYTHGRRDGETAGLAIIEALRYGLPVVSHAAEAMGHLETIGDAGTVCATQEQYCSTMKYLLTDNAFREELAANAKKRYAENYNLAACISKYEALFEEVYARAKNNGYGFSPKKSTDEWLQEWVGA